MLTVKAGRVGGSRRSPRQVIISAIRDLARTEAPFERAIVQLTAALESPDEPIRVVAAKALADIRHRAREQVLREGEDGADGAIDTEGEDVPTHAELVTAAEARIRARVEHKRRGDADFDAE